MPRRMLAAAVILSISGMSASAQTADDLVDAFPMTGWTGTAMDNPVIGCVATFAGNDGLTGYEITLADGKRRGELRYNWEGVDYLATYEIDFIGEGIADRVNVRWSHAGGAHSHGSTSSQGFDLAEVLTRFGAAHDEVGGAILEFVWHRDFCGSGQDLAALFPAAEWVPINAEPVPGLECAAIFGPTADGREGYYAAFANESVIGEIVGGTGADAVRYEFRLTREGDGDRAVAVGIRTGSSSGISRRYYSDLESALARAADGPMMTYDLSEDVPDEFRQAMAVREAAVRPLLQFVVDFAFCD